MSRVLESEYNRLPLSNDATDNTELTRALWVSWTTCLDLTLAATTATFMDAVFPEPDEEKTFFKTGVEAYSQAVFSVLLMDGFRQFFRPLYGRDPLGGIAVPFFLFLQPKLRKKFDMLASGAILTVIQWMWPDNSDGSESSESVHKNKKAFKGYLPSGRQPEMNADQSPRGMNDYMEM